MGIDEVTSDNVILFDTQEEVDKTASSLLWMLREQLSTSEWMKTWDIETELFERFRDALQWYKRPDED